ncbi:hypothetical protein Tcan_00086 [Toxocara canis]|uniref:Uncharacterized protein n=1 Tax=Toxocara canis TaxID=6265 RepID=A0A0B2V387_TOXCA|nr:hypothetical protein Tcan_00086 [Toxocara canis]
MVIHCSFHFYCNIFHRFFCYRCYYCQCCSLMLLTLLLVVAITGNLTILSLPYPPPPLPLHFSSSHFSLRPNFRSLCVNQRRVWGRGAKISDYPSDIPRCLKAIMYPHLTPDRINLCKISGKLEA